MAFAPETDQYQRHLFVADSCRRGLVHYFDQGRPLDHFAWSYYYYAFVDTFVVADMLQIGEIVAAAAAAAVAAADIHTFDVAGQGSSCETALGSSSSSLDSSLAVAVVGFACPVIGNCSGEEFDTRTEVEPCQGQQGSIVVGAYRHRMLVGGSKPSSVDP